MAKLTKKEALSKHIGDRALYVLLGTLKAVGRQGKVLLAGWKCC